jgi:hypothetical protein
MKQPNKNREIVQHKQFSYKERANMETSGNNVVKYEAN